MDEQEIIDVIAEFLENKDDNLSAAETARQLYTYMHERDCFSIWN